jgi:hypothetical protein
MIHGRNAMNAIDFRAAPRLAARCLLLVAGLCMAAGADAGLFRAYLSSTGSDANSCTLPAPCRLLPAALAAIDDGGEVWMLDSANYNTGPVVIDKSATIVAIPGAVGSVVGNAGNAIFINAPSGKVTLRNLSILNLSGGTDGVHVSDAALVVVERCEIYGLANAGVYSQAINGNVVVSDSVVRDNGTGISLAGLKATIDNTQVLGNAGGGIMAADGARVTVVNSVIAGNGNQPGIAAWTAVNSGSTTVLVERSVLRANGSGFNVQALGTSTTAEVVSRHNVVASNLIGAYVNALTSGTATVTLDDSALTHNGSGIFFAGTSSKFARTRQNNTFEFNGVDLDNGATLTPYAGM